MGRKRVQRRLLSEMEEFEACLDVRDRRLQVQRARQPQRAEDRRQQRLERQQEQATHAFFLV